MTSPNWYDQEPYCDMTEVLFEGDESVSAYPVYNIPLIIEKAKEREKTLVRRGFFGLECATCPEVGLNRHDNFCKGCGAELDWNPDNYPHQQVDNE